MGRKQPCFRSQSRGVCLEVFNGLLHNHNQNMPAMFVCEPHLIVVGLDWGGAIKCYFLFLIELIFIVPASATKRASTVERCPALHTLRPRAWGRQRNLHSLTSRWAVCTVHRLTGSRARGIRTRKAMRIMFQRVAFLPEHAGDYRPLSKCARFEAPPWQAFCREMGAPGFASRGAGERSSWTTLELPPTSTSFALDRDMTFFSHAGPACTSALRV